MIPAFLLDSQESKTMSEQWKLKQSRKKWKQKAIERGEKGRAQRKEIQRIRAERNYFKQATQAAKADLEQQRRQIVPYGQQKVEQVYLVLSLFVCARLGFRAISRVLKVVGSHLGLAKTPCAQTASNWVTRFSIVKMQTVSRSMSDAYRDRLTHGYVWLIDLSIGLGSGKILSILALPLQHHHKHSHAPRLQDVQCVAVAVADSWTGVSIANFLTKVMARTGTPSAFLKDGGADLNKAVNLLHEQGRSCPPIADISHIIANLFKHEYGKHPLFSVFVSACGRVSKNLKQTLLASLAPPKVSTKARFMNLHHLVAWADQLLQHSPCGAAAAGSMLAKLRGSLDELPECKSFIKRFLRDATPMLACQKILKCNGLNEKTYKECQQLIDVIPASSSIRKGFTNWAEEQLAVARELKLGSMGLPISTDILESLFGIGKRLGVGQTKDANWIALRLPTFCGTLTQEDVDSVVQISVAEQQAVMEGVSSLIAQRRKVLPSPGTLEVLAQPPDHKNFQMLPDLVAMAA
jgi:hypothetical protein